MLSFLRLRNSKILPTNQLVQKLQLAETLASVHVWPNAASKYGYIAKVRCNVYHQGQSEPTREDVLADNTMKDDFAIDNKDFTEIRVGTEVHVYRSARGQWFMTKIVKDAPDPLTPDTPSYMPSNAPALEPELPLVSYANKLVDQKIKDLKKERKNRKDSIKYHSEKLAAVEAQLEELGAL